MIVIDASALAKYLLREEGWESVEEVLICLLVEPTPLTLS